MAGMKCPRCGQQKLKTVDSRPQRKRANYVYRRRKCDVCWYRFATREYVAAEFLPGGSRFEEAA